MIRFQAIIESDIITDGDYTAPKFRDFRAGEPGDLFTNKVYIHLGIKTTETSDRDKIFAMVEAVTQAECQASGGRVEASVRMIPRAPVTTRNDDQLAVALQQYFGGYFGDRFWVPPMNSPVKDIPILSGPTPVAYVYWKLGSTDPVKWDEGKKKGGEHIETSPHESFFRVCFRF